MRSILFVAAGLFQLTSAAALYRTDPLAIKEPSTGSGAFFPASDLPTLYYNGGQSVAANQTFTFSMKTDDRSKREYFDAPGLQYYTPEAPDVVFVSLYKPVEQVEGSAVHRTAGLLQDSNAEAPTLGYHLESQIELWEGGEIPDGTYHVGIIARGKGKDDKWLSPAFNIKRHSETKN